MPQIKTTGRHEVTVKSATFGESPNGTPFVELGFANDAAETISGWLYLSEAAFARSVQVLREVFHFDNNFETLPAQVVNKRCAITTEFEEFDGKERLKVKWINTLRAVIPLKDASALAKFSQAAARVPAPAPLSVRTAPKAASQVKKPDPF